MPSIEDSEFGTITIRRSARASRISVRVGPDGRLRASMPLYTPIFMMRRMINGSRTDLRKLLEQSYPKASYSAGMQIGKSHTLRVIPASRLDVSRKGQQILVQLPESQSLEDPDVIRSISDVVAQALRIEAKSYLPKRLKYLADRHGFSYEKVRFSHASSRWGSCSSTGTISLNIALMKLPFELIDYVILHELTHTREMNHSDAFWSLLETLDPLYKQHRRAIKAHAPTI